MLIITNGDSAAGHFRHCGLQTPVLPWRDVLHDGPVPALPLQELSDIRSLYISSRGWGPLPEVRRQFRERDQAILALSDEQEVVLWFEHDLYDQLQLLQVVHEIGQLNPLPRVHTVFCNPHITSFDVPATRALFDARKSLTPEQIELATKLWMAFTLGDYEHLVQEAVWGDATFPHLGPALVRWLEEFPWTESGLNRTERQILHYLDLHPGQDPVVLFRETQKLEEDTFLGDNSFWSYVEDLVERGILQVEGQAEFFPLWKFSGLEEFRKQRLSVAPEVLRLLAAREPLDLGLEGEDGYSRWMGGRLIGANNPWCWDGQRRRLVQSRP